MAQTVRLELHRERLVATLEAQAKSRRDDTLEFASEAAERRHKFEKQADEVSAILACIRLVIE